jgi:YjbE family integral membrane protein
MAGVLGGSEQVAAMWTELAQPTFWLAVVEIIWINLLLSGDNAVVIALACRNLPPRERRLGMVLGAGVAVVLRIIFAGIISVLMALPYLKIIGALTLLWVAAKLLVPPAHDGEGTPEAADDLWRAVKIIAIADVVMSLDNVLAVAAASKGDYALLGFGLAISIPMVVAGSAIVLSLLQRFPFLVWGGAAVLGWIAGDILNSDPVVAHLAAGFDADTVELALELAGVAIAVVAGLIWRRANGVALDRA